jgi:hypothetical protein
VWGYAGTFEKAGRIGQSGCAQISNVRLSSLEQSQAGSRTCDPKGTHQPIVQAARSAARTSHRSLVPCPHKNPDSPAARTSIPQTERPTSGLMMNGSFRNSGFDPVDQSSRD